MSKMSQEMNLGFVIELENLKLNFAEISVSNMYQRTVLRCAVRPVSGVQYSIGSLQCVLCNS